MKTEVTEHVREVGALRLTVSALIAQVGRSCYRNPYVKLKRSFLVSSALQHARAASAVNYRVISNRPIPYRRCCETELVPVCPLQPYIGCSKAPW